ncbi:hypothetical protein LOZ13_006646 [Ophidiomyces ophidiicola]|nr:hypothetical protein LOZ13_006646 [Ophidiomyces ophidiicola]
MKCTTLLLVLSSIAFAAPYKAPDNKDIYDHGPKYDTKPHNPHYDPKLEQKPHQKPYDHNPPYDPKHEHKPEKKPDQTPDHKLEQKVPDYKPDYKPEHKPEHKPDHKPEHKPEYKPEHKPDRNLVKNPPGPFFVVKENKPQEESSAVVTFNLDQSYKGRTCKFLFEICANCITGSRQLDIFTVLNPPGLRPHPGPSRDQHKGRLEVLLNGKTNWIQKYNGFPKFPCPTGLFGFEVVGAGELVKAGWTIGKTGPKIEVL